LKETYQLSEKGTCTFRVTPPWQAAYSSNIFVLIYQNTRCHRSARHLSSSELQNNIFKGSFRRVNYG